MEINYDTNMKLIQVGKGRFVNPDAIARAWFYEQKKQWFSELIGQTESAVQNVDEEFRVNFEQNVLPKIMTPTLTIRDSDQKAAEEISNYLLTGMHHSTPEGKQKFALIIARHHAKERAAVEKVEKLLGLICFASPVNSREYNWASSALTALRTASQSPTDGGNYGGHVVHSSQRAKEEAEHDEVMLADEASDAMRKLPLVSPTKGKT